MPRYTRIIHPRPWWNVYKLLSEQREGTVCYYITWHVKNSDNAPGRRVSIRQRQPWSPCQPSWRRDRSRAPFHRGQRTSEPRPSSLESEPRSAAEPSLSSRRWAAATDAFAAHTHTSDHQVTHRPFSVAGRLSPPDRAPGLRHLSTLQRRWRDGRAPAAPVSSSWPGQKRHLAGRSIQHGSTTHLEVPGADWGGDPSRPGMRERESDHHHWDIYGKFHLIWVPGHAGVPINQSINPGFLKWPKKYKRLLGPLERG